MAGRVDTSPFSARSSKLRSALSVPPRGSFLTGADLWLSSFGLFMALSLRCQDSFTPPPLAAGVLPPAVGHQRRAEQEVSDLGEDQQGRLGLLELLALGTPGAHLLLALAAAERLPRAGWVICRSASATG